ncbi:MAG: tetratricopeptide repeat protein [Candidatus Obscuribacterales bacterium]
MNDEDPKQGTGNDSSQSNRSEDSKSGSGTGDPKSSRGRKGSKKKGAAKDAVTPEATDTKESAEAQESADAQPVDEEALKGYPSGLGPPPYPYTSEQGPSVPEQISQWQAIQGQGGQIAPGYGIPVWVPTHGWVLMPYQGDPSQNPQAIQPGLSPGAIVPELPPGAIPLTPLSPDAIPNGGLPPGAVPLGAIPPGAMPPGASNQNLPAVDPPLAPDTVHDAAPAAVPDETTAEPPQDSTRAAISTGDQRKSVAPSVLPASTDEEPPQDSTRAVSQPGRPLKPFVSGGGASSEPEPQDSTRMSIDSPSASGPKPIFESMNLPVPASSDDDFAKRRSSGRRIYLDDYYDDDEEEGEDRAPTEQNSAVNTQDLPQLDPATLDEPTPGSPVKTIAIVGGVVVAVAIGVAALTIPLWNHSTIDVNSGLTGLTRLTKSEEERLLLAAKDAAKKEDDWDTIELSTRVIDKYPNNSEAYFLRARAEMEQLTYDKAVEDFDRVKRLAPGNVEARLYMARCLVERQEASKAIEELDQIQGEIRSDKMKELYLHTRGLAELKIKDNEAAKEHLAQAAGLAPNPEIFSDYARCLLILKDYAGAQEQAQKAINLDKESAEAYHILGDVALRQQDTENALKYYDLARSYRTQDVDYCLDWARLAAQRGRYADALDALGDLEQSHPADERLKRLTNDVAAQLLTQSSKVIESAHDLNDPKAWTDWAYAKRKLKKLGEAIKGVDAAIRHDPKYGRAYLYRAQIYTQLGKPELAVADATRALELDRTLVNAYFTRAYALTDLKRWTNAISDYNAYIRERHKPSADAELNLGLCYHMLGNYDEALDHYSNAIELDPSNSNFYVVRANVYLKLGNTEDAMQDLTAALTFDDKFPRAYQLRGDLFMMEEDYERAADDYEHYVRMTKSDPKALLAAADALLKAGKPKEAQTYCVLAQHALPTWAAPYQKNAECFIAMEDDQRAAQQIKRGLEYSKKPGYLLTKKAEICLLHGDYSTALSAAEEAQASSPTWTYPPLLRAVALLYESNPAEAMKAMDEYVEHAEDGNDQLNAEIWKYLIRAKESNEGEAKLKLRDSLYRIQITGWPMPEAKYLAGDISAEELLNSTKGAARLTEAHTFIGIKSKLTGEKDEAQSQLDWVKEHGDRNTLAYAVAMAELQ